MLGVRAPHRSMGTVQASYNPAPGRGFNHTQHSRSSRQRRTAYTLLPKAINQPTESSSSPQTSGLRDAGREGDVPEYTMSPVDHMLLALFRRALLKELKCEDTWEPGFPGVVQLVRQLKLTSGSPEEIQERGTRVIKSLLPFGFVPLFRKFLQLFPDWFGARHAAATTVLALNWLVGPSEVNQPPNSLQIDSKNQAPENVAAALCGIRAQEPGFKQGVLVKRCRVLEETKCASICLNVCQVPTQRFFTEEIGLPMTMLPNFDNFECQFVFGRNPPPPEESDIFVTPCFQQCPSASRRDANCSLKQYPPSAAQTPDKPQLIVDEELGGNPQGLLESEKAGLDRDGAAR